MLNKHNFTKFFTKRNNCTQCTTTIDASLRSTDTHTTAGMIFITEGQSPALSIKNTPVREIRHLCDNTYLLTPWCRVLLETLTGLQLVKKFPAFHGTRRFFTVLTCVRHLSLSWANPIQSTYPHPTS